MGILESPSVLMSTLIFIKFEIDQYWYFPNWKNNNLKIDLKDTTNIGAYEILIKSYNSVLNKSQKLIKYIRVKQKEI